MDKLKDSVEEVLKRSHRWTNQKIPKKDKIKDPIDGQIKRSHKGTNQKIP